MAPSSLFKIEILVDALKTERETIPYTDIQTISWRNTRVIQNFIPEHETFCVLIKKKHGLPTVLFRRIKLRYSVVNKTVTETLKTGLKVPPEKEAELTNNRYELLALVSILEQKTGIKPKESRWLLEDIMEIYCYLSKLWI